VARFLEPLAGLPLERARPPRPCAARRLLLRTVHDPRRAPARRRAPRRPRARNGRFAPRRDFYRRTSCSTLTTFKLERPAFGGRRNRALGISFRVAREGRVAVEVRRGGRVVRRYPARVRRVGVTHRLRLAPEKLARGTYEVRLTYVGDQGTLRSSLFAQRL
jgi:hypothetical protein